jgi:hypothetical protein
LKRKDPDLGDIRNPTAFISHMRDKGHQVAVEDVSIATG